MDDGDEQTEKTKKQRRQTGVIQRYLANVSNVLSPIWVRRPVQANHGSEWFLLGCRCSLLLHFRLFLVVLYLTYEILK
jgi:hypothetical protein